MGARSYLSHLQCSLCQQTYNADQLHTTSSCCSRPLLAQYDLTTLVRDLIQEPGDETVLFFTGNGRLVWESLSKPHQNC